MPMLIEQIISAIAPHHCNECGAEGKILCNACATNVFTTVSQNCGFCDIPTQASALCSACKQREQIVDLWCVADYSQPGIMRLIHQLKFESVRAAGDVCAMQLHAQLPTLPADTIVSWLPTAPRRVRQRGYDQSKRIAQQFARLRHLDSAPLLLRLHNQRQVGATRHERQQLAKQAYGSYPRLPACSRPILLVDDVLTTGASLQAAVRQLHNEGFQHIMAATIARRSRAVKSMV